MSANEAEFSLDYEEEEEGSVVEDDEESSDDEQDLSETDRDLFHAVQRNDAAAVQQSIRNGVDVNCVHERDDTTPLLKACENGYDEIVRILLEAGADARWKNKDGWSAILQACVRREYLSIVEMLINHDKDLLEMASNYGTTPLLTAVYHQQSETVRFLLDRGANAIDVMSNDGVTTLMRWCEQREADPEIVRMLIAAGVKVEARNDFQQTALHFAAKYGAIEAMRELILQHNANMFAVTWDGRTPFDEAYVTWGSGDAVYHLRDIYGNKMTQDMAVSHFMLSSGPPNTCMLTVMVFIRR
jgi:ankyrin repeat protein